VVGALPHLLSCGFAHLIDAIGDGRLELQAVAARATEVPTAKWSELRYGLRGQLEDHDGEASQA
jgi:hypothetical protein